MFIKTKCQCGVFAVLVLLSLSGWAADTHKQADMSRAGSETGLDVGGQSGGRSGGRSGGKSAALEAGIALLQNTSKSSPDKAKSLLQPLADDGNTLAMLWLGRACRDGLGGMEKDVKASFQYFQKAGGREGMNPEAQLELGRAYMYGEGTDKNLIAAYMWTALSAEKQGDWTHKAVSQRNDLQNRLTPAQQEKAKELVEQLRSIYLKQP